MTEAVNFGKNKVKYISISTDPVPCGLRELAAEITSAVLLAQPIHLYHFIAEYLQDQLLVRDASCSLSHIIVRNILEDELTYEAMLRRWGISTNLANYAASIIQAVYRGHTTRKLLRAQKQIKVEKVDAVEVQEEVQVEEEPSNENPPHTNHSATNIQEVQIPASLPSPQLPIQQQERPPGEPLQRRRPHRPAPLATRSPVEAENTPAELTPASEATAKEAAAIERPHEVTLMTASVLPPARPAPGPAIPLSGMAEAVAVVLPMLESLLWTVVEQAERRSVQLSGAAGVGTSQQVKGGKTKGGKNKSGRKKSEGKKSTPKVTPQVESLFSPPRGGEDLLPGESRLSLEGVFSLDMLERLGCVSVTEPPSHAAVKVDSQEFYECQSESSTDETRAVATLQSEIDMDATPAKQLGVCSSVEVQTGVHVDSRAASVDMDRCR